MFDQILKYGSYIVDALREYKQPAMVYLPPHSELRGGAWVVLDHQINPEHMEMYACLRVCMICSNFSLQWISIDIYVDFGCIGRHLCRERTYNIYIEIDMNPVSSTF